MGALLALAARVGSSLGVRGAARGLGRLAVPVGGGVGGFALGESLFGGPSGSPGGQRRRRRRKALTADDVRLSLIIASSISKKAAENFILSRTRAG